MGPVGDFLDKNDGLGPGGLGYPFRNNPFRRGIQKESKPPVQQQTPWKTNILNPKT